MNLNPLNWFKRKSSIEVIVEDDSASSESLSDLMREGRLEEVKKVFESLEDEGFEVKYGFMDDEPVVQIRKKVSSHVFTHDEKEVDRE